MQSVQEIVCFQEDIGDRGVLLKQCVCERVPFYLDVCWLYDKCIVRSMLINTFLDTEDFVHLYYPEDEPAAQGCGAGARMASRYPPRPPSPEYKQVLPYSRRKEQTIPSYRFNCVQCRNVFAKIGNLVVYEFNVRC